MAGALAILNPIAGRLDGGPGGDGRRRNASKVVARAWTAIGSAQLPATGLAAQRKPRTTLSLADRTQGPGRKFARNAARRTGRRFAVAAAAADASAGGGEEPAAAADAQTLDEPLPNLGTLHWRKLAVRSCKMVLQCMPAIVGIAILSTLAGLAVEVGIHVFKSIIAWVGAKHSAELIQSFLAGEGKWACNILRDIWIIRYVYARVRPDIDSEPVKITTLWRRGVWAKISVLFVVMRAAWWKVWPALPRYFDLLLTLPVVALEGRDGDDAFDRSTKILQGSRKQLAGALAAVYAVLVAVPLPAMVVVQMLAVYLVIRPVCAMLGVPPEVAERLMELPNPETAFPSGVEQTGAFSAEQIVVVIMATVGKFLMGGLATLGMTTTLAVAYDELMGGAGGEVVDQSPPPVALDDDEVGGEGGAAKDGGEAGGDAGTGGAAPAGA